MSTPFVHDINADVATAYPGKIVTFVTRAHADAGIRAVVFWLDRDNSDGQHRFVANSADQPLAEVTTPDPGTTDQYSLRIRVDDSWPIDATICTDICDSNGQFSSDPIKFITITTQPKPIVAEFLAETLGNGDIHLIARASNDGQSAGTNIAGITFFLDQNGNAQWDSGTDIDLGADFTANNGVFEKTITPQIGWNTTWFTASAFDVRPSTDKFGPPKMAIHRGDATPPTVDSVTILSQQGRIDLVNFGETIQVTAHVTATQGIRAGTLFFDANRNGIWDSGIDSSLATSFTVTSPNTFVFNVPQNAQFGRGWQPFAVAVQDNSGRGNDSWSGVHSAWVKLNNTAFVSDPVPSPAPLPVGTATMDLTFRVHDDNGVQTVREAFIDVNGDGIRQENEPRGVNLTFLDTDRANGRWRLTFNTSQLAAGNYTIHLWVMDYQGVTGPRIMPTFAVV